MVEPDEASFDPGEQKNDDLPLVLVADHWQDVLKSDGLFRGVPHDSAGVELLPTF